MLLTIKFMGASLVLAAITNLAFAQPGSDNANKIADNEAEKHLVLQKPDVQTFSALTKPLPLYPGEVTNSFHKIKIPPGPIAIYEFSADVVEKDIVTGEIVEVPLKDAYLHHHVALSNHDHYHSMKHWWSPMKPHHTGNRGVGFGAGTESRGTKQKFPFPYAFTTVKGEDELIANVHVINTREMDVVRAHKCLECPCTLEDRDMDYHKKATEDSFYRSKQGKVIRGKSKRTSVASATITGAGTGENQLLDSVLSRRKQWYSCNDKLLQENNTACSPSLYYGGLICCEHGEFCLDEYYMTETEIEALDLQYKNAEDNKTLLEEIGVKQSTYYLRYTLSYSPIVPENKQLYLAACCDASGNLTMRGNVEYDIPQLCDPNDPTVDTSSDDCVHETTAIQALHGGTRGIFGTSDATAEEEKFVDVVYIVGHLHRGGIELVAYNHNTSELICRSSPTYGDGKIGEIGNEPGYINSMSSCTFDPPLRMKTSDRIRIVGRYNATQNHTGVMSLLYVAVTDVPSNKTDGATVSGLNGVAQGFWKQNQFLAILLAVIIVVVASVLVVRKHLSDISKRRGYEQVPTSTNL